MTDGVVFSKMMSFVYFNFYLVQTTHLVERPENFRAVQTRSHGEARVPV